MTTNNFIDEITPIANHKEILYREWEHVKNDASKDGKLFEKFVKLMIEKLCGSELKPIKINYDDKQIDYQIINTSAGPFARLGLQIHFECKDQEVTGAPPCYKALGHIFLAGGRISTTVVMTTGKFANTAYKVAEKVSSRGESVIYSLILIDHDELESFLKSEESFNDWFYNLWLIAGNGSKISDGYKVILEGDK